MLKTLLRHGGWFLTLEMLMRHRTKLAWLADRPCILCEGRVYTYGEVHRRASQVGHLLEDLRRREVERGRRSTAEPLALGIYQDNTAEFVFALLGAAYAGAVVFCLNTGFRGDTLASVIQQARLQLLLTDADHLPELERGLEHVEQRCRAPILVADAEPPRGDGRPNTLAEELARLRRRKGAAIDEPPNCEVDNQAPFLVIYTSGTTGAPKGVVCSQLKLLGAGLLGAVRVWLRPTDRGYVCVPLFHSNAWLLGLMPLLVVGGSFLVRRKFSASAFEADILEHGVTYLNYVGQPIHYILQALEQRYGDAAEIERTVAADPRNLLRIAQGNGATQLDRAKLVRYFGMEHVYELYGSTEAAISTVVRPGDPPDSVGRVRSKKIVILDEHDEPCAPGIVDDQGRLANYDEAIGEIARKIDRENVFFDGYYDNEQATQDKYRDGYFRSGDLGHIRVVGRRRYLYFDGRTDDWIRKDGENFSAENVARYAADHPGVALAVAYGAPCEVADERVMVALQLAPGASFDPQATFDRYVEQQVTGGMDPKWMPDYVRIVPEFELTTTQKIRIPPLRRRHFKPDREDEPVFYRRRGDTTYRPLTRAAYAAIEERFEKSGRRRLLAR